MLLRSIWLSTRFLVFLLLVVKSVHPFGVELYELMLLVWSRVSVFGVLAGSLICAVFSSVPFFIAPGVLEVLFHDYLLHGGYGVNFLSLLGS